MKPLALIAASSIAALAAGFAVAQPQPIPPAGGNDGQRQERTDRDRSDMRETREQRREEWRQRRAERMEARMNERLAKLRTDLQLTPEQVPLFQRVEEVIKKRAAERGQRTGDMSEQRENFRHADIMERLDMMAQRQGERAARSKELADAVRPLWQTMSDPQKTIARRSVREAFGEMRGRMERMRDRWQDRGERRGWHDEDRGPRRWHRDGDRDDRRGDRDDRRNDRGNDNDSDD